MRREQNIVGRYYRMSPKKRIDEIVAHYDCFQRMMKDYERELFEWLEASRAKARRDANGDTGVRVQTGNRKFSVTENQALEHLEIEAMMENCNLSGSESIEDYDDILRGLMELKLMKKEYSALRSKIGLLHDDEKISFERYISRKARSAELAEELEIEFESVRKRMYRIRKKVYRDFVEYLEEYDDQSIFLFAHEGRSVE